MVEKFRIPYAPVKGGNRYFQPTPQMQAIGFEARPLGPEGPEARAEAWRLYEAWKKARRQGTTSNQKVYPTGSIGWAFERYRRTDAWALKALATRKKDWEWSWRFIEPVFGDVSPSTVEIEHIEELRSVVLERHGLHTANRLVKVWRALWRVMAAMRLCDLDEDPSKIIRNTAPRGRDATWQPGELARLGKRAWREGYRGLAAMLAVYFDTQFSPSDCRLLRRSQLCSDARGAFFRVLRAKTGEEAIGTLSRRTEHVLHAYLSSLGVELHDDAPIFRNRSGKPYSADTLGDDFRTIRNMVLPGDKRVLLDIRRTGAVEALAGDVNPAAMSAKMGNSIDQNRFLEKTYLPKRTATVRLADEARKRGRRALRENK